MNKIIQGKPTEENISVKRFGYLFSTFFMVLTAVAMIIKSSLLPLLFIAAMYFIGGSLWVPALIKPFYKWFGRFLVPVEKKLDTPREISTHESVKNNR